MWKYSLRDLPELKQAVCDYYERRYGVAGITPDMVASCNGTQEGVGHLGLALLNPGDMILVPDPCYPVFEAGAKIADAELAYYPLDAEHDFLPYVAGIDPEVEAGAKIADAELAYYPLDAEHDFLPYVAGIDPEVADRAKYMIVSLPANPVGSVGNDALYDEIIAFAREHDLADRAKYMIVSLPANPVGSVGNDALYDEIIAFAREHDLLIVHDNAYSDIVFDGPAGGTVLAHPGALEVGVVLFPHSKSFNDTGARIGFRVGRPDVVAAFTKLRSQIDYGMFMPIQKAAIAALEGPLEEVEAHRLRYQERRDARGRRFHQAAQSDRLRHVHAHPEGGDCRARGPARGGRGAPP